MKKYLLLITLTVIIFNSLLFSSCKKTTHFPHPSAGGVRLASYSMIINVIDTIGFVSERTENDNYAFKYDSLNRLSYEIFTSNNSLKPNENITFTYSNDTIYKTVNHVTPSIPIEKDTFIVNTQGQITLAFTPNTVTSFQYYENLLTKVITTDEPSLTAVTTTYTSVVGNFLNATSNSPFDNGDFSYYTDYTNRIGDYLQICSFTMYGSNIYQYTNLVHYILGTNPLIATVTYNIDAYSNITSSFVSNAGLTDSTVAYSFQYENY